jgi:hypothetical protein
LTYCLKNKNRNGFLKKHSDSTLSPATTADSHQIESRMIMKTLIQNSEPQGLAQPSGQTPPIGGTGFVLRRSSGRFALAALLAGLFLFLFSPASARAERNPTNCLGSGLGISLFTSLPDVHIGDTIYYSVNVFNTAFPSCDAGETNPATAGAIQAYIVTPNGVTNHLTLRRTFLAPGDSDYYTNVVSYVVRAQDILSDGTVRATATDQGDIHQNDTDSYGGGNQGVNTEVNLPCIQDRRAMRRQCGGKRGHYFHRHGHQLRQRHAGGRDGDEFCQ